MNRGLLIPVWAWVLALVAALGGSLALAQDPPPPEPPAAEPQDPSAEAPQDPPAEAPQDPPAEAPQDPPAEAPQDPPAEAPQDPPAEAPEQPAAAERALPGTDIVCLLDSSRSVGRADLQGHRIAALQVLLSVVARQAGDRVAVARYAGDLATREHSLLLDWTEMPRDGRAQADVFGVIFDALQAGAEADARASDWNAATDVALARLLESRGASAGRPLWIILVTDGELDPIEGDAVPAAYLPEQPADVNGNLREHVTAEAEARFLAGGLQQLIKPGVWVTPLRVGPGGHARDLCGLISEHSGATVVDLAELGPLGVLERVLAELPAGVHPAVDLRVLIDETVVLEPGDTTTLVLPVPLAGRPAISIVEVPDGASTVTPALESGERGDLAARTVFGGRHRVIAWHDAWGRDTAAISAPAGGTARVLHLSLLNYDAKMEFEDAESTPASPGGSIKVAVSLSDPGSVSPLEALPPLDDAMALVEVIDAAGNVAGSTSGPIFGEFTVRGVLDVAIPDSVRGACTLRATVRAMSRTPDTDPLFTSESVELQLPVRAPLMVRFAVPRPMIQQAVEVYGEPDGPRPAADALTIPVRTADADPVPVPLEWNAERARYEGIWIPANIGNAEIVEGVSGHALVKRGQGGACEVRPRTLTAAPATDASNSDPNAPTGELVSLRRMGAGVLEGRVRVAASLLPTETCTVVVQALGVDGAPIPGFVVATAAAAELPVGDNRVGLSGPVPMLLLVRFAGEPGDGVTLRFTGDLPGGAIAKTLALTVPPTGTLFKAALVACALLLLIIAAFLFQRQTCPQFEERQLRLHTPGRTAERTRYLREFPRGSWGRVALGTPEAPRSVELRLVGLRGITAVRCRISSRKPYIRIQVNGTDLQGHRDLQDGDQIVLKGATLALRYTYYDSEGPAGEQTRMLNRDDMPGTVAESADLTVAGTVLAPNEFLLVSEADLPYVLSGDGAENAATVVPADLFGAHAAPVDRATAETGAFVEEKDGAAETLGEGDQWPVQDGLGEETGGYSQETGAFEDDEEAAPYGEATDNFGEATGHFGDETSGYDEPPTRVGEETGVTDAPDPMSSTLGAETGWADEWASQLGEETGAEERTVNTGANADDDANDDDDVNPAHTLDESTQIDTSPLDRSPSGHGADGGDDNDDDDDASDPAETLGDDNTLAPGSVEDQLPDFLR